MPTYLSDEAMNELCDTIADSPAYCETFNLLPDPITGLVERYQVEFELGAMLDMWRHSAREVIEVREAA